MAREVLPRFLSPMLLTPGPVPDGDGWACEVKWDGARAQVAINGRVCGLDPRTMIHVCHALRQLHANGEVAGGDG